VGVSLLGIILTAVAAGCGGGGGGGASDFGSSGGTGGGDFGGSSGGGSTTAPAGTLRGVYVGHQGGFNILGGYEVYITQRGLTFFPNGEFITGSAIEGPDAYNTAHASVKGRYRVSGGQLELEYDTGDRTSARIGGDGRFTVYGVQYQPLPRMDGARLSGSYGRIWSDPWYGEKPVIRFSTDGRFEDQGVLGQTALSAADKYLNGERPIWNEYQPLRGAGTYRIQNNTLYLDYSTGHRETVQIYTTPEYASRNPIPAIVLGGSTFERKGD
jgi:hypothetical protein